MNLSNSKYLTVVGLWHQLILVCETSPVLDLTIPISFTSLVLHPCQNLRHLKTIQDKERWMLLNYKGKIKVTKYGFLFCFMMSLSKSNHKLWTLLIYVLSSFGRFFFAHLYDDLRLLSPLYLATPSENFKHFNLL